MVAGRVKGWIKNWKQPKHRRMDKKDDRKDCSKKKRSLLLCLLKLRFGAICEVA